MLGPILITQIHENALRDKFAEVFKNRFKDRYHTEAHSAYLARDEQFQQVKLQLRALRLIREVGIGWTLTPRGDHVMTQVAAIRSSARA